MIITLHYKGEVIQVSKDDATTFEEIVTALKKAMEAVNLPTKSLNA